METRAEVETQLAAKKKAEKLQEIARRARDEQRASDERAGIASTVGKPVIVLVSDTAVLLLSACP